VLARPKPPTYMHFKKEFEEGDQRFGARKGQGQAPLVAEAQNGGMEMKHMSTQKSFKGPRGLKAPDGAEVSVPIAAALNYTA
jgi:palmitoyltransferase ZDHHC9/14/18